MTTSDKLDLRYWEKDPDTFLSQRCASIEENEFGPKLESFGEAMIQEMHNSNGVGLAAPQIGLLKRIFVMSYLDSKALKPFIVCNPKLSLQGEEVVGREGCLSLPEIFSQVKRSSILTMEFRNPLGENVVALLSDLNARVAQHETDHLDGIMFFDRLSVKMRKSVLKEWEKKKEWILRSKKDKK